MADLNDPTQNVTIWDDDKGVNVNVITDGSIERLAVDANVSGGVIFQKLIPKTDFDANGPSVDGPTTLLSVTATGKLDFISLNGSNSNYSVKIIIDGTDYLDIELSDLSDLGLTASNATSFPFFTTTASKNFVFHPFQPIDFETSFAIELEDEGNPKPSVSWFISWGEVA